MFYRKSAVEYLLGGEDVFLRTGTSDEIIAEINSAPRAIVCLFSPWSIYPIQAEADLSKALAQLNEVGIRVDAFSLDEESTVCQKWLALLGLPPPYDGKGVPQGWGALFWLEFGRVVTWVHHGNEQRPVGIIGQTKLLWQENVA